VRLIPGSRDPTVLRARVLWCSCWMTVDTFRVMASYASRWMIGGPPRIEDTELKSRTSKPTDINFEIIVAPKCGNYAFLLSKQEPSI
jgi:hypothetical protein